MSSPDDDLFVATPLHDGKVCVGYMLGLLSLIAAYPARVRLEVQIGPHLPLNRDLLTARFLASQCSRLLWVDSDIGFRVEDVRALVETGKDFIGGCYATKDARRVVPAKLTGKSEGRLRSADYVPAGFLLLARSTVERMTEANPERHYRAPSGVEACALWFQEFGQGDDVSFCARWRALGGEIWLHTGVVVDHVGDHVYRPANTDGGLTS